MTSRVCLRNYTLVENLTPTHPGTLGPYLAEVDSSCWLAEEKKAKIWQCVKTNSTPSVHIKIAGIYGCE